MKRLTSLFIVLAMAMITIGSSGVALSDERETWNEFSSEAGVEYVLECCDVFKSSIGEDDSALSATLSPEDLYGP